MNSHFMVPGHDNVVDFIKYRNFVDCKKLFTNYKTKLYTLNVNELDDEKIKLEEEERRYPGHLMTTVKRHIFDNVIKTKTQETK